MRSLPIVVVSSFLALACGSEGSSEDPQDTETTDPRIAENGIPEDSAPDELLPDLQLIEPQDGDMVMFSDIVRDIQPGEDVTYCTFTDVILDEPFFYNVGLGSQAGGGHHAVLQYATTPVEPGTRACDRSEMDGQVLMGGTAGKTVGTAIDVPPEIAVEIPAGAQFVINHHYINTGTEPVDGQAMMIARAHSADEMILAGQMIMGTIGWQLPAQATTVETTEVVYEDDMEYFMTIGHMHEWGTYVTVEVDRVEGGTDMVVDTPWTAELASGVQDYNMYPIDEPFVVHKGDTVRLTCEWDNTTDAMIEFPREMCFFVGYTVDGKNRYAFNGMWIDPDTIDPATIDRSQLGL